MADAGVVVSAGDPTELLRAVIAVRNDPEAAARFAANGRRHRQDVLDERIAMKRWNGLVEKMIAK